MYLPFRKITKGLFSPTKTPGTPRQSRAGNVEKLLVGLIQERIEINNIHRFRFGFAQSKKKKFQKENQFAGKHPKILFS
jgi:hypothetical protein